MTQGRIGEMLGVRRESITEIALRLQRAGIIDYCRGQITLLDRRGLEERGCTCDKIVRRALATVTERDSGISDRRNLRASRSLPG